MSIKTLDLSVTTQGPLYPPSELMDINGNFIVIGMLNLVDNSGNFYQEWGSAIVSSESPLPAFGNNYPYKIIKKFDWTKISKQDDCVLYTLPYPIPCNNYSMNFAPEQNLVLKTKPSFPLHDVPIPDIKEEHGRKVTEPVMLSAWVKARGMLKVTVTNTSAIFSFEFDNLIPDSLYTVMALRENDLNPTNSTRPGPLGVPNVFITNHKGEGNYCATMPNPFPAQGKGNRIVNVVLLWMSYQMNHGGAIGIYGLGVDIHAQLKLSGKLFQEFETSDGR